MRGRNWTRGALRLRVRRWAVLPCIGGGRACGVSGYVQRGWRDSCFGLAVGLEVLKVARPARLQAGYAAGNALLVKRWRYSTGMVRPAPSPA